MPASALYPIAIEWRQLQLSGWLWLKRSTNHNLWLKASTTPLNHWPPCRQLQKNSLHNLNDSDSDLHLARAMDEAIDDRALWQKRLWYVRSSSSWPGHIFYPQPLRTTVDWALPNSTCRRTTISRHGASVVIARDWPDRIRRGASFI
jgi:hypothetical protein